MVTKKEYGCDKIVKLSWKNIDSLIGLLVKKIGSETFDYVIGLPRGGLMPAVMLSHKLNTPYLCIHEWKSMNWKEQNEVKVLLVDDIADKGNTIMFNIGYFSPTKTKILTLCSKPRSKIKPNFVGMEVMNDEWILFPWEREEVNEK